MVSHLNQSRQTLARIIGLAGLIFFLVAGRAAITELFVETPGVHVARVQIEQTPFAPQVSFYWDTPTMAWFLALLGSLIGGFGSLMLLWRPRQKRYLLGEMIGFIMVIIGFVLSLTNFLDSAGDF